MAQATSLAAGEHRKLDAGAEAAVEHRGEGLKGRIKSAAAARAQSSQHASENHADAKSGAEAAAAQEALLATEAAEATGATAELTGEAAEAREGAETAAATVLEPLLEAGLVGVLAATGLLHAGLEASLIGILTGLDPAVLGEALLEAGLEGVLARETAAAHHLLHLSQLHLHLLQLLLHHPLRASELTREALAGKSAGLLHGEVVELLSLLTAALLLLAEKFA